MKWKKKIWVFDDIIPRDHQDRIKHMLIGDGAKGSGFPWHFVPDVTGGGSRDARPAFSHTFIREGQVQSHESHIRTLEPMWAACMEKMMEMTESKGDYAAIASRTFLQLPLKNVKGGEADAHHIDRMEEHFALLYYVCDSDGDTLLYENMYSKDNPAPPQPKALKVKKRVRPKQGRVVIFDGYYWHTATQPTRGPRCVINTDVLQNG